METSAMSIASLAILAVFAASTSPVPTMPAQYTPPREAQIVCTEQYAPVCGRIDNVTRTFPNACYARAAGAEIVAVGPCGDVPRPLER